MSTQIIFQNQTELKVDVFWIDFKGKEKRYASLFPAQFYNQQTYAGHKWIIRDQNSKQKLGECAGQPKPITYEIEDKKLRSERSNKSVEINFKNSSPFEVEVFWIDYGGKEKKYHQLRPGASIKQGTYVTHPWVIRDKRSGAILDIIVPGQKATTVKFSGDKLRSKNANKAVKVKFKNSNAFPVSVYWLDYKGKEKVYATLKPGASYTQATYATHPWRIREINSGAEVGLYIPSEAANQTYDIKLNSQESTTATTLDFFNRSHLDLALEWIDLYWVGYPYCVRQ